MAPIEVVNKNGTYYLSKDRVGSSAERGYFKVMTERWGKLYFASKGDYKGWCDEGRSKNESSGRFNLAKVYFENTNEEEGGEDMLIIEAYTVEQQPAANEAAA